MKLNTVKVAATVVASLGALLAAPAHAGKTLDGIKTRGQIICGVHTGLAGFSAADSNGKWNGLDSDICRAIAASTLGDGDKVKYVPLPAQARFTALQSGEIDILSRNTTFTLTRDASLGLNDTVVTYYDGQGFMVPVKSKIKSAKQLKNQTVCVQSGTTTEKNLTDYSKTNGLNIKPVVFEKLEAVEGAYFSGRCIAYTTDASGDDEWFAIVKWVIYGLQEAEEYGVTAANVDDLKVTSKDPVIGRLLGTTEDTGKLLGLDKDWLVRAIKTTGNYGEIFERNVGPKSPLQLPRGLNNLWNKGGLVYPYPVR